MKHIKIKQFLVVGLALIVILNSCSKEKNDSSIIDPVSGKYENGFFILGEGSYGRNSGAVNFYKYGDDTVSVRIYEEENPGKILSNTKKLSTLQFATVFNQSIYLLCKKNGPIVKLNELTLKEEARYVDEHSDWRSIIPLNGSRGLVSAYNGVYQIDLNTLTVQDKLTTVDAVNTCEMLKKGNYVYLLQSSGANIISASDYSFIKGFSNIEHGFVQTPNGKVWASTGKRLIAIDNNLDTTGIALKVSVNSFGLNAPTVITASTKENAVFYHFGNSIYKYIDGDASSLAKPFISIAESPFMVYGVIRYDKNKDYIVVNGIQGFGSGATVNFS